MHAQASTTEACSGSALGLLFRQVRDAMWARMERELALAGHDLTFRQYITIKKLADALVHVVDGLRVQRVSGGRAALRASLKLLPPPALLSGMASLLISGNLKSYPVLQR